MSNITNIFNLPSGPEGGGSGSSEREYRLADLTREGEARRLELRLSDGKRYALHYGTLLNILDFGPHAPSALQGQALMLLFSIGEVVVDGRNLHLPLPRSDSDDAALPNPTLFEALRDERVRTLHAYNPAFYDEPPESTPVITAISYEGRLQGPPEEPPPPAEN